MEHKLDESRVTTSPSVSMATKASGLVSKKSAHKRDMALQVANTFFASFRYASAGVSYSFMTQRIRGTVQFDAVGHTRAVSHGTAGGRGGFFGRALQERAPHARAGNLVPQNNRC